MKRCKVVFMMMAGLFFGIGQWAVAQAYSVQPLSVKEESGKSAMADKGLYQEVTGVQSSASASKAYTIGQGGFVFYETFENSLGTDPYPFPDGWTVMPTPGNEEDKWLAATMTLNNDAILAHSGSMYGFVLTSPEPHDTWAISPGMELSAGNEYLLRFWVLLILNMEDESVMESFQVMIGNEATVEAMQTELYSVDDAIEYQWKEVSCRFSPESTGTYHIGFHSLSPANAGGTAIDDISVVYADQPAFYGFDTVDFGSRGNLDPGFVANYRFTNVGTEPLEVSLGEAPDFVSVSGLPVTVEPDAAGTFQILFDEHEVGAYSGELVLRTNHVAENRIPVTVIGTVTESRLTDYCYENFEEGVLPADWIVNDVNSFMILGDDGVGGSRALRGVSLYAPQLLTHNVRMGDDPQVSFYYRAMAYSLFGGVEGPADPGGVRMRVSISEDYGVSFTEVYSILPEGENGDMTHVSSEDFAKVVVPVPDSFANKVCMVQITVDPSGIFDSWELHLDNVALGSPVEACLVEQGLYGNRFPEAGVEYPYTVRVQNQGGEAVGSYTVSLKTAEGDLLGSVQGSGLEVDSVRDAVMNLSFPREGLFHVYGELSYEGAGDASGRLTDTLSIRVMEENSDTLSIAGQGDDVVSSPVDWSQPQSVQQILYLANEIGANNGLISGLRYILADGRFQSAAVRVYVGETEKSDFSDQEWIPIDSLVMVFDGAFCFPEGECPMDIPFSEPYVYEGKNLVVRVEKISDERISGRSFEAVTGKEGRVLVATANPLSGMSLYPDFPGTGHVAVSDMFPSTVLFIDRDMSSGISGTVTDVDGPVENARVSVLGSSLSTITAADGTYRIPGLSAGTYDLSVRSFGHRDGLLEGVEVEVGSFRQADIVLEKIGEYAVEGVIVSAVDGSGIADATVKLLGYMNYKATTGPDGKFSIPEVYGGSLYVVDVSVPFYKDDTVHLQVDSAIRDFSFALEEQRNPVSGLTAVEEGSSSVAVSWGEPLPQFRYDDNEVVDKIGYPGGGEIAIIGSVHRHHARIKEISWFLTDGGGEHPFVNLYLFDLDETGTPLKELLWSEKGVSNIVMQWNTYQLPQTVDCPNGFLVGMSVDTGFLSLGMSSVSDEWPLMPGMHYAIDDYTMPYEEYGFADLYSYYDQHLMIRASGEDIGELDYTDYNPVLPQEAGISKTSGLTTGIPAVYPEGEAFEAGFLETVLARASKTGVPPESKSLAQSYKVYRLETGRPESEWSLLAENVAELEYVDEEWAALDEGVSYQYAVVACYADGEADPVLSNVLRHDVRNETAVCDDGLQVFPNPANACVWVRSEGRALGDVRLLDMTGRVLSIWTDLGANILEVDLSGLPRGMYILDVDGLVYKVVKK